MPYRETRDSAGRTGREIESCVRHEQSHHFLHDEQLQHEFTAHIGWEESSLHSIQLRTNSRAAGTVYGESSNKAETQNNCNWRT